MKISISPIGYISSPTTEPTDENWGAIISEIHLKPEYHDGLTGLDGFSHAIIIFYMHQAEFKPNQHLRRHPRGRSDLPLCDIFAQRAKHRPNPIGVTTVSIVEVQKGMLIVRGLDAIDGTPVLDIKPYVPAFNAVDSPRAPGWMVEIMEGYF